MRLIDADVLRDRLQNLATIEGNQGVRTYWTNAYEECADMVDEQPTINPQKWIPCSEGLPEEKAEYYWVCLDSGGQCQCRWTNDRFGLGANKWSEWGWSIMDKPMYTKIVAWMPLPEPYKENKEYGLNVK